MRVGERNSQIHSLVANHATMRQDRNQAARQQTVTEAVNKDRTVTPTSKSKSAAAQSKKAS
jgi:hypothetical protein